MPRPHPPEFRRRAVQLARTGDQPVALIAKDLGISESCLRNWVKRDQIETGDREGLTEAETTRARRAPPAQPGLGDRGRDPQEGGCVLRQGERAPKMKVRLVRELADDGIAVTVTCRVLGVSTSGFYEWRDRPPSQRDAANAALTETIPEIHVMSRGSYGSPMVHKELTMGRSVRCSRKRIERLMRNACLQGSYRRKGHRARPLPATHDDLVARKFCVDRPNKLWVTDITEHPTLEGKVYAAVVLDAFSRRVIGLSIADHLRSEIVVDAQEMARWRRGDVTGTIVHSDHGSQTIHVVGFRAAAARGRAAGIDGTHRVGAGQRHGQELLQSAATRFARHEDLGDPRGARCSHLRMDRSLVQPTPSPLLAPLSQSDQLREAECR